MYFDTEDIGFVTFAQNSKDVDYLRLAYLQAMNIKATQHNAKYAVIVDTETVEQVTDQHRRVFDHVIVIQKEYNKPDSEYKLANECQIYWLSPFKETIKVESDLLFTGSIAHWMPALRLKNVVLSTGCRTYTDQPSDNRRYRKFFDENNLPDVYNGLMYFRKSENAFEFFTLAQEILLGWDNIKEQAVKNCREDTPSTDVLYGITAQLFGREYCTLPTLDFINFVHMKSQIQGWVSDRPWYEVVMSERDGDLIRINNLNQYGPVHYYDKAYVTDSLIEYYEQRIGIN
jgi:hypothetical protein